MAGEYIINWTDDRGGANPLKPRFVINPNTVNGPSNANSDSPLQLPGRFAVNYGELIAENLLHLLENFASPTPPPHATAGMIWFDTEDGVDGTLKVYPNIPPGSTDPSVWITVGTGAAGSGGGGGGSASANPPVPPGTDFTAELGSNYFINTSTSAVTVTLPTGPSVGDVVGFTDVAGTFDINALTVNGGGQLIMSAGTPLVNDVKYSSFKLAYSGATYGWRIVE
jgi:hypothetical protein